MENNHGKQGCRMELHGGEMVADRYGVILCEKCDAQIKPAFMAAYLTGKLHAELDGQYKCGDYVKETA